jgi:hypothetical protein
MVAQLIGGDAYDFCRQETSQKMKGARLDLKDFLYLLLAVGYFLLAMYNSRKKWRTKIAVNFSWENDYFSV